MNKDLACKLAVYDYSHLSPDGTFWAWRPQLEPSSVLEDLLSHASSAGGLDENRVSGGRSGGACCIGNMAAVFRIMDGGRDERNRPGRRVIAFLIADRASLLDADAGSLFESTAFREVADLAARGGRFPDRAPNRLAQEIRVRPVIPGSTKTPRIEPDGRFALDGRDALAQIGALMQLFPRSTPVALSFDVTASGCSGRLFSQVVAPMGPRTKNVREADFVELDDAGRALPIPARGQGTVSPVVKARPAESLLRKAFGTSTPHTVGAFVIVGVSCFLAGCVVGALIGGSKPPEPTTEPPHDKQPDTAQPAPHQVAPPNSIGDPSNPGQTQGTKIQQDSSERAKPTTSDQQANPARSEPDSHPDL